MPTVSETVLPGFDASSWQGIVAPVGTPPEIIAKLNEAIQRILRTPEFKARFAQQGIEPSPSTPKEFGDYIQAETERWKKVAPESGIQPQ